MTGPETRLFHVGDLLSVTTGRLVSLRYMDGLLDILGFLTGEEPDPTRLPEIMAACRPYLLSLYPDLAGAVVDEVSFESWRGWLDEQVKLIGEWLPVARPQPGQVAPLP